MQINFMASTIPAFTYQHPASVISSRLANFSRYRKMNRNKKDERHANCNLFVVDGLSCTMTPETVGHFAKLATSTSNMRFHML